MTRFVLPLLLAIAACSPPSADIAAPDPEPNAVAAAAVPTPAPTPALTPAAAPMPVPMPIPMVPDSGAVPKPGVLKTFRDWAVGCDNGLRCTLASLLPARGDADNVTLNIVREGDGATSVFIDSRDEAIRPASLWIDGRRIATELTPESARAIAAALPAGRLLELRNRKGRTVATVSLKGASAALRYVDAVQRHAGTADALVARARARGGVRERPAESAAAPALPVIVAPVIAGVAATPTPAQLAAMRRQAGCDIVDDKTGVLSPEAHAVGGGRTLVILPCSSGAYNLIGALFVIDGKTIAPADVDAPSGFDETGAESRTRVRSVVNGAFADGTLTSYAKGRGIGDCGVQQSYVWDGTRLRLSEQSEMGECRGNPNYITTWRTEVLRR